jgi:HEAT repeat protein
VRRLRRRDSPETSGAAANANTPDNSVLGAIGRWGGEKALPILEQALSNPNQQVQWAAAGALGDVGGDRALALIDKALGEARMNLRLSAVRSLKQAGEKDSLVVRLIVSVLKANFAGDPAVERALADVTPAEPAKPETRKP